MYHSIETKGGLYVLQNGASRTVHRVLRPKMLFGQVLAACTDGSKFLVEHVHFKGIANIVMYTV